MSPFLAAGAKDDANGEGSVAKKDALHGQQAMAWKSAETCPVQVTWEEDFGLTGKYSRGESVRPWDVHLVATRKHGNTTTVELMWGIWDMLLGQLQEHCFNGIFENQEVRVLMFYMSMFFSITPTHAASHPYSYTQPDTPMHHTSTYANAGPCQYVACWVPCGL